MQQLTASSRAIFRHHLCQLLSLEELELVCQDVGFRLENLHGGTLEMKAASLVLLCEKTEVLQELVQVCRLRRPNIDWVSFIEYETVKPLVPSSLGIDLKPFGEVDCEKDIDTLKDKFSDYYFTETPFTQQAIGKDCFLIIGRRGSGKTALSEYFKFQTDIPNSTTIDIHELSLFEKVFSHANANPGPKEIVIPRLAELWEEVIWLTVIDKLKNRDKKTGQVYQSQASQTSLLNAVKTFSMRMANGSFGVNFDLEEAKQVVVSIAQREPIIIAIDTLETIDFANDARLRSIASLIDFASAFNRAYSKKNIHLKVFMMAEAFPHLKEEVILNPLKTLHDEVYMHWRPKDLLRLISWRFYQYLRAYGLLPRPEPTIDWRSHTNVISKMWHPYFGREIVNGMGLVEPTFPYVLRHTQMRPRQLIYLCDAIAKRAQDSGNFPLFSSENLVDAIRTAEVELADEVIRSYDAVYPHVAKVVDALGGIPTIFQAKELDKRAPLTAAAWERGKYSPGNFRQLVSELGIVGRVRSKDESQGVVTADFEHFSKGRLGLLTTDECVIHPMFYSKLRVTKVGRFKTYPFPKSQDFEEIWR